MATQLDRAAVAALVGLGVGTLDTYKRDGRMPAPDGMIGRSPWWWDTTIKEWDATRDRTVGRRWPADPAERQRIMAAERGRLSPAKAAAVKKAAAAKLAKQAAARKKAAARPRRT